MVGADENTPVAGSGQRHGKPAQPGKKSEKRSRKGAPRQDKGAPRQEMKPDQALEVLEQTPAVLEQAEAPAVLIAASPADATTADASPFAPAGAAEPAPAPVSYQAITNAYGDYTRKSIEQTGSFFEQLAGVRSFNRAFQLQTEYAQQAYETFVAESRKIGDLHRELTREGLQRFESLVAGTKTTRSR